MYCVLIIIIIIIIIIMLILKGTGHATAPAAGDYVLSFTANMVSSNSQVQLMMIQMIEICDDCDDEFADNDEQSQAIWCALYKQSPGDEGWQVEQSPSLAKS